MQAAEQAAHYKPAGCTAAAAAVPADRSDMYPAAVLSAEAAGLLQAVDTADLSAPAAKAQQLLSFRNFRRRWTLQEYLLRNFYKTFCFPPLIVVCTIFIQTFLLLYIHSITKLFSHFNSKRLILCFFINI